MIRTFFVIFLGGGLGSVMRYGVQLLMQGRFVSCSFPWATFSVNIFGSFLIGLFYALSAKFHWSDEVRLLLATGLCGGFTTFSTFSNDSLLLLRQGEITTFAFYLILSVFLGILAVFIGAYIAK